MLQTRCIRKSGGDDKKEINFDTLLYFFYGENHNKRYKEIYLLFSSNSLFHLVGSLFIYKEIYLLKVKYIRVIHYDTVLRIHYITVFVIDSFIHCV
jgi:hypothetical protein